MRNRAVIEHIGFYALSRHDHELADVMHAMIVTVRAVHHRKNLKSADIALPGCQLARRSNLLVQSFSNSSSQGQSVTDLWRRWAERETVTR
jgi:hypothetical protein